MNVKEIESHVDQKHMSLCYGNDQKKYVFFDDRNNLYRVFRVNARYTAPGQFTDMGYMTRNQAAMS